MVNKKTLDSVLKSVYVDAIRQQLNRQYAYDDFTGMLHVHNMKDPVYRFKHAVKQARARATSPTAYYTKWWRSE